MLENELLANLPRTDERAIFVGPTLCGKTTLARKVLAYYDNVVVVDTKRQFSWHDHKVGSVCLACTYPTRFRRIIDSYAELEQQLDEVAIDDSGDPIVYKVPWDEVRDQTVDQVPSAAMERGHTLVYYDDFVGIASASDYQYRAPNLEYATAQGAQLHVAIWASIQSPLWVPKILTRLSNHRYVFNLRSAVERRAMEEICGPLPWTELAAVPNRFMYANDRAVFGPRRLKMEAS